MFSFYVFLFSFDCFRRCINGQYRQLTTHSSTKLLPLKLKTVPMLDDTILVGGIEGLMKTDVRED